MKENDMRDESMNMEKSGDNFMIKLATIIVDKRNLIFLIFIISIVFCLISANWVKVENSMAAYLSDKTETTQGLNLMEEQFVTYGTAKVMVTNITYDEAEALSDKLSDLDYVSLVMFDDTEKHFGDFAALYNVTFPYDENDERCLEDYEKLQTEFEGYDAYFYTTLGDQESDALAEEMKVIIVCVAVIVLAVLLFTSTSYAEVPVLIMTFLASAALASGTNYLLGTISFVSDSVAIVLQLALSVDYAVIFSNRYKDEHKTMDARSADIIALSKAIPEISASSLTTIGGLIAMGFMQYGIGPDLAVVLIKAIILSLLSVFLLMPGLIMLFADLMDKTTHKNFVPKIPFVGKFAYATRFFIPPVFVVVIAVACVISNKCPYVYGFSQLTPPIQSERDRIAEMMDTTFGKENMVALVFPAGDYQKEEELIAYLMKREEVESITGLANTEAKDGVMLTQKLNAREFSELMDIDREAAEALYAAYAINDEDYAKLITGINEYKVSFVDMFLFLYDEVEEGYLELDDETMDELNEAHDSITVALSQLQGEEYSRILIMLNLPQEGEETFAFIDELHRITAVFYGEDARVLAPGESTSQYDLKKAFARDNQVVNIISALAVLVVLLFTFMSAGMPVLLIMFIEGCIWINFSYPTLVDSKQFFLGYLIVSSIQMGANIDYAIVVSSRYQEVKKVMSQKEAIIDTMNFAFPTIITSGSMLAMAGILIGKLTSNPSISGIGENLGRGTIISIFAVLFVLPQILLLGDKLIEKTSFAVNLPMPVSNQKESGLVRVDGIVRGQINGVVYGTMHAVVRGDVSAMIVSGSMSKADESEGDFDTGEIKLLEATVAGTNDTTSNSENGEEV